jgi:hypothetical protein
MAATALEINFDRKLEIVAAVYQENSPAYCKKYQKKML